MMSKLEIRMQNNELEARVIELETLIHSLKGDLATAEVAHDVELSKAMDESAELVAQHEELQAQMKQMMVDLEPERYDSWYKRLHPVAGSEPDPRVAIEPVKLIA